MPTTLITLSTAWLIGIAAAHYLDPHLMLIGLLATLPLAGLILWRDDPKVRRIAACGLFFVWTGTMLRLCSPHSDPQTGLPLLPTWCARRPWSSAPLLLLVHRLLILDTTQEGALGVLRKQGVCPLLRLPW